MYRCTAGKNTIGYGFNVDAGVSEPLAEMILKYQIDDIIEYLEEYQFWSDLNEARQTVLIDMCFQLGKRGFNRFRRMKRSLYAKLYEEAADEILDSNYANQTPNRAQRNADIMRNGEI